MSVGSTPLKLLKYRMLESFGLCQKGYIDRTIKRTLWAKRFQLVDFVRQDMAIDPDTAYFGIFKFVDAGKPGMLPNRIVRSLECLEALQNELTTCSAHELWFCKTEQTSSFWVAGRIIVDLRQCTQTVEQLWNSSPRLIEQMSKGGEISFVRADRPSWGWRFLIRDEYRAESLLASFDLIKQFRTSQALLHQRYARECICFEEFISRVGLSVFSLEYKIVGGTVNFIDWDTADDRLVLEKYNW